MDSYTPTASEQREIQSQRDYIERARDVYSGTVIVQRNGREIRVPLQLPPRAEHFTGREHDLAQLLQTLQPGRVVTLCGPGGIGKSALAAEAIWQLTQGKTPPESFPDGVIWHSFYTEPQADLALENIARVFGEEPRPTPRDAAQRALAGRQILVLLDGSEDADDLRNVLAVTSTCGVIVTSRSRHDAVAERQDLQALPLEEAVTLLQAWGKTRAADDIAAPRICELVGGVPLAVRLVGRYVNETGETAAEYLEWLESTPLEALNQGERKRESVPLLLKRSVEQVSEAARQVLGVCGVLALAPFSREVLAAVMDATPQPGLLNRVKQLLRREPSKHPLDIRRPLNELVNYGLLVRPEDRYEVSHALIYTYARKCLHLEKEVLNRLAAYYESFANEQSQQGLEGYARLDMERPHIMQVMEGCQEREQWQTVTDLVWAVDSYLNIQGYWTERQTALEMGVEAAQQSGNQYNEGGFLGNLGNAYRALGQVTLSIKHHQQAVNIFREIGDKRNEGAHLGNLGNAYADLGQVDKAIEYYEQALAIDREIGRRQGEGIRLGNLGIAYHVLGQVDKAIEYYEQALTIARDIGDRQREGIWLGNLGNAYDDLGQVDKAIEYYEQALAIHRETGYRQGEGDVLYNLGIAYKNQNQLEQAKQYFQQALVIREEIKSPDAEDARKRLAELEGKSDE